jgi:methylated-DNA-[protein]-cysteine S-methyltransferase
MRTATGGGVAWDVPVRLVAAAQVGVQAGRGDLAVHRVAIDVPLPELVALDVTTVRVGRDRAVARIAPVRAGTERASPAASGVAELLDELRGDASLPVLAAGTPFTRCVLAALLRVPSGATCTYTELAAAAGYPRAVRAVATVMARNRVPLLLPCHRVVPRGGGAGRYAWGTDVKAALLAAESGPLAASGVAA